MESETEATVIAFDGSEFVISRRRWLHILDRHAELGALKTAILETASSPDELFADPRGTLHLVKTLKEASSDFLIVIARKMGSKTYLVTAYFMNGRRKERRYRKFRKLRLS